MRKKEKEVRKKVKPWPTKDAMEQIYEKKLWGSNQSNFYSGAGSHQQEIVNPYIIAITSFLATFKTPPVICDLGCGDFNIGNKLVKFSKKYIAIDIVSYLIAYNKEKFREDNLEFLCLDIAKDELPEADCAIVRQVLQHLSNAEVHTVAHKLTKFKYVILTEHIPNTPYIPNKDIISGQGIRLKKQSGLDLLAPPFNLKVKEITQLTSVTLNNEKEIIVTNLYKMF